jgi:hypothetical protein
MIQRDIHNDFECKEQHYEDRDETAHGEIEIE